MLRAVSSARVRTGAPCHSPRRVAGTEGRSPIRSARRRRGLAQSTGEPAPIRQRPVSDAGDAPPEGRARAAERLLLWSLVSARARQGQLRYPWLNQGARGAASGARALWAASLEQYDIRVGSLRSRLSSSRFTAGTVAPMLLPHGEIAHALGRRRLSFGAALSSSERSRTGSGSCAILSVKDYQRKRCRDAG